MAGSTALRHFPQLIFTTHNFFFTTSIKITKLPKTRVPEHIKVCISGGLHPPGDQLSTFGCWTEPPTGQLWRLPSLKTGDWPLWAKARPQVSLSNCSSGRSSITNTWLQVHKNPEPSLPGVSHSRDRPSLWACSGFCNAADASWAADCHPV